MYILFIDLRIIIAHNIMIRDAFINQLKNILYRNARTYNARFAKVNMRINRYSIHWQSPTNEISL